MDKQLTREERQKRYEESVRQAIAEFPYERIEVAGDQALATWESLRARHGASAVVVGDEDQFTRIVQGSAQWPGGPTRRTPGQILEAAARLRHPDDLITKHSSDMDRARERAAQLMRDRPDLRPPPEIRLPPSLEAFLGGTPHAMGREELIAAMLQERPPELGEWPTEPMGAPQLSVANETLSGTPLAKACIVILPTDDWTTIPAYLNWGNWNDCPAPEYHVAALRSWRDRFGAELIGLSHDVMNIRVNRRPETRDAALNLAREQYVYCSDIVDQGVETLSALGAVLMQSDWWYFWWD